MRKILIVGILAFYSHISNAQMAREAVQSAGDTTVSTSKTTASESRLNKLEEDVQVLKKENESLKKQMKEVKSVFPGAKRKVTVSRVGSKQLIVE